MTIRKARLSLVAMPLAPLLAATIAIVASACDLPAGIPLPTAMLVQLSDRVDGYVTVAAPAFHSGRAENVSVSLLDGQEPGQGQVSAHLLDTNGSTVSTLRPRLRLPLPGRALRSACRLPHPFAAVGRPQR